MVKVAAVIRVTIGRGIIPIEVRETVIGTVVPIPTKANRTNSVGINEVRVAPSIPHNMWTNIPFTRGKPPRAPPSV